MRYAADIETDDLLPGLTKVHAMVLVDLDTGEVFDFADQPGYRPLAEGLEMAASADLLTFHNGTMFDVPAIQQVYPGWTSRGILHDTLILSRLVYPDIKKADYALLRKNPGAMPGNLIGTHSLKSWGYRLGDHKVEFSEGFGTWSPTMHSYMIQDGRLGAKLYKFLMSKQPHPEAVEMEHRFQEYLRLQEQCGIPFDRDAAEKLYASLAAKREELARGLRGLYPGWLARTGEVTPPKPRRRWTDSEIGGDSRKGVKGYWTTFVGPYSTVKLTEFNPASRHHIANRLKTLRGWEPEEFNKDGHPKVDDLIISQLPYPEAKQLATYLMVDKRIGQLAEGNEAWLKADGCDGRIHGQVTGIGTATFRCSHRKPNMTQVPKVIVGKVDGKRVVLKGLEGGYGWECRSLFYAPPGYSLVGADASGLELRCLAHYLHRYDGGRFMTNLLEGDIHQVNMDALQELAPNRDCAKTAMYALLYGAGDKKLGLIVLDYYGKLGLTPPSSDPMKTGKALRERMQKGLGIGPLMKDLNKALENRDWLKAIDGRKLPVRSKHAALNTLLQSAGSIAFKVATVLLRQDLSTQGLNAPEDWSPAAHCHDEVQLLARTEVAHDVGTRAVLCIRAAGDSLSFRCPLDGEYKVGRTWAETH